MKKSLKVLSVLMAALAIGSFAGCKKEVDSGGKIASVASGDGKAGPNTVVFDLTDADADVEWFCWTRGTKGTRGPIVEGVKYAVGEIKNEPAKAATAPVTNNLNPVKFNTKLTKGSKYIFQLPKGGEYNFYFYQKPIADKKVNVNDKDLIGYVDLKEGKSVNMKLTSNGWKEVDKQAAMYIKQNEPSIDSKGSRSFFEKGDYTITEIWPLEQVKEKDGTVKEENKNIYKVTDSLKYLDLSVKYTDEKATGFLFPAGDIIVTTMQGNRGKVAGDLTKDATSYKLVKSITDKKGNYLTFRSADAKDKVSMTDYKTAEGSQEDFKATINGTTYTGKSEVRKIKPEELKEKEAEYWGTKVTLAAHEIATNGTLDNTIFYSKPFNIKFTSKDQKKFDYESELCAAPGVTYYEVHEGDPSEK